jgi:hypothetical protein
MRQGNLCHWKAEAGKYRFGVVDVTTEGNSVRSVLREQNADETLILHRASSVW